MKGVLCYELFGGIALKINTFSFFFQDEMNPSTCVIQRHNQIVIYWTTAAYNNNIFFSAISPVST